MNDEIQKLKKEGLTSIQVAQQLNLSVEEVNRAWTGRKEKYSLPQEIKDKRYFYKTEWAKLNKERRNKSTLESYHRRRESEGKWDLNGNWIKQ